MIQTTTDRHLKKNRFQVCPHFGIFCPKMKIAQKYTNSQAIKEVDEVVSSSKQI